MKRYFAVLDTETNWNNQVMSLGVVISDANFTFVEAKYYVFVPEYEIGGIFEDSLFLVSKEKTNFLTRKQAICDLLAWFEAWEVDSIFAYNAAFDFGCLPELSNFNWYDIMRLSAYRQYNDKIPPNAECYSTGKMKRGYGVQPMLQMLSGDKKYLETHNALFDAADELKIMQFLGHSPSTYIKLNKNKN